MQQHFEIRPKNVIESITSTWWTAFLLKAYWIALTQCELLLGPKKSKHYMTWRIKWRSWRIYKGFRTVQTRCVVAASPIIAE